MDVVLPPILTWKPHKRVWNSKMWSSYHSPIYCASKGLRPNLSIWAWHDMTWSDNKVLVSKQRESWSSGGYLVCVIIPGLDLRESNIQISLASGNTLGVKRAELLHRAQLAGAGPNIEPSCLAWPPADWSTLIGPAPTLLRSHWSTALDCWNIFTQGPIIVALT